MVFFTTEYIMIEVSKAVGADDFAQISGAQRTEGRKVD